MVRIKPDSTSRGFCLFGLEGSVRVSCKFVKFDENCQMQSDKLGDSVTAGDFFSQCQNPKMTRSNMTYSDHENLEDAQCCMCLRGKHSPFGTVFRQKRCLFLLF